MSTHYSDPPAAPPTRAGAAAWAGLAVLVLPTILLFAALTVLFMATPHIAADLAPSNAQLLWVNDIYGFVMAGLLVTMGTLGDRVGRRRILLTGAAIFAAASLFAAFAPTAELLIVARAAMGVGAAAVTPSTLSLISTMFRDDRQRGVAIGLWAASVSVGVAIGPLVGGLLLEAFWWGAALLLGAPVMAVVLLAAPFLVPEYRAPQAGKLDPASVALSLAALLPFVYGVKKLAETGPGALALGSLVAGVVFGVIFVRRQLRLPSPLLDMRLFSSRTFSGALTVFMLATIALGGVYLLFTQYLQLVAGLSPLEAGLWILPGALGLVVASALTPLITRRIRPAYAIAGGLVLSAVGYLVLTQVGHVGGLPLLVTGFYILYPGIAPTMALVPDLVIGAARPEQSGEAAAVESTASDLGVSLGVAFLGSIGAYVYRAQMADTGGEAGQTLPGAFAAAEEMSADAGAALVGSANAAFTSGLNIASLIAAIVSVGGAILAVVLLRSVPPSRAGVPGPDSESGQAHGAWLAESGSR